MESFLVKKDKVKESILNMANNAKKADTGTLLYINNIADNIFYLNGPTMINGL